MAKKRYRPEEIVIKLRQVEVLQNQGTAVTDNPVFCIQECGVLTAMAQGDRFCFISTYGQRSVFFYRPLNIGSRFSRNEFLPSLTSSVCRQTYRA